MNRSETYDARWNKVGAPPAAPRCRAGAARRSSELHLRVYRFFAGPFWATAAFASALNAPASAFSPSWMSIALRMLPSKLELKRRDGFGILAPRANGKRLMERL